MCLINVNILHMLQSLNLILHWSHLFLLFSWLFCFCLLLDLHCMYSTCNSWVMFYSCSVLSCPALTFVQETQPAANSGLRCDSHALYTATSTHRHRRTADNTEKHKHISLSTNTGSRICKATQNRKTSRRAVWFYGFEDQCAMEKNNICPTTSS